MTKPTKWMPRLTDAQADLSLRWAQSSFCWFCHEAAHITKIRNLSHCSGVIFVFYVTLVFKSGRLEKRTKYTLSVTVALPNRNFHT